VNEEGISARPTPTIECAVLSRMVDVAMSRITPGIVIAMCTKWAWGRVEAQTGRVAIAARHCILISAVASSVVRMPPPPSPY